MRRWLKMGGRRLCVAAFVAAALVGCAAAGGDQAAVEEGAAANSQLAAPQATDAAGEERVFTDRPELDLSEPQFDPEVGPLARAASDYLGAAKAFTYRAEITFDDVTSWGQKIQFGSSLEVDVRRPDAIHARMVGDAGERRFWYDGRSATLYNPQNNTYATAPCPATIPEALDHLMTEYGATMPLAELTYPDLYEAAKGRVQHGLYFGLHEAAGVPCHHLAFVQELIDWQIWIQDGDDPLIRKVVITYKSRPESPQYTAVLTDWDLSAELPEDFCVADFPDDAFRVQMLPRESPSRASTDEEVDDEAN
jgi:hypothetical protein